MVKRTYDIAFKKEVVAYIEAGHSIYEATTHFSARDHFEYDKSMFYQWYRNRDKIAEQGVTAKGDTIFLRMNRMVSLLE